MRVTVDASVAVKWFVAEDHRKKARILLGPRIERYAPDLLPVECASAIWKKARRGEIRSAVSFLDEITKLQKTIEALSIDERMDLLVLGWVGDGRRHTRRRLFDFAIRSASNIRYIAGLGMRWREGLRRWPTWDRTVSSRG